MGGVGVGSTICKKENLDNKNIFCYLKFQFTLMAMAKFFSDFFFISPLKMTKTNNAHILLIDCTDKIGLVYHITELLYKNNLESLKLSIHYEINWKFFTRIFIIELSSIFN